MNRQERRARMSDVARSDDKTLHFVADMRAATTLYKDGQLKEAADTFRRILKVYADHPDIRVAWTNLGAALRDLGDVNEAAGCFKKAKSLKPDHAPARHNLGMALAAQGKADEAEAELRAAIDLDPAFVHAWISLGLLHEARGDLEGAEAALREAVALADNNAEARFSLANLLRRRGSMDEAIAHYRRCIETRPGFPEALVNLGSTLAETGDAEGAIENYLGALRLVPQHEGVHMLLGGALEAQMAQGQAARAREHAKVWQSGYPASPVARHMAAALLGSGAPARAHEGYVRVKFDGFAAIFDEMTAQGRRGGELLRDAVTAALPAPAAGLDVLDAGCGTGLCAGWLRPYARQLVGIDLSQAMLVRAQTRGYDRLLAGELTAFLADTREAFDLIAGNEVLAYFGALEPVFGQAAASLRAGGHLAVTLDAAAADLPWELRPNGRFAHGEGYVRETLEKAGFSVLSLETKDLRMEQGEQVPGLVLVAKKA